MQTIPQANTTIRIHAFTDSNPANDGTTSCDFRCPNFIGATQGDHHHTLHEWDVASDSPFVAEVIEFGPIVNKVFQGVITAAEALAGPLLTNPVVITIERFLGTALGELTGTKLRLGVWDKQAPANDVCP